MTKPLVVSRLVALSDCSSMALRNRSSSDAALYLTLQVFQANNDATEVVLNKLHTPLLTRFVRIRPQTWHLGIALRLELFGCRVTGELWGSGETGETILGFSPLSESIRLYRVTFPKGMAKRVNSYHT